MRIQSALVSTLSYGRFVGMRFMRFGSNVSRAAAVGDEFLQVGGDFGE
jgi:hypothetical protein